MAFNRCIAGLYVFQATLFGILVLKAATLQSLLVLPLFLATGYFWKYCHKHFYNAHLIIPLDQLKNTAHPPNVRHSINMRNSLNRYSTNLRQSTTEMSSTMLQISLANSRPELTTPLSTPMLASVVTNAEEHSRQVQQIGYLDPIFSSTLPKPWIPETLANLLESGKMTCPLSSVVFGEEDELDLSSYLRKQTDLDLSSDIKKDRDREVTIDFHMV